MLKSLELNGFKSFAEECRLEFPAGVTVIVGPNGSGKSNVVDAIKWILGEQSAKSLRGKEMIDVIFNGSSSRKPLNLAEASLLLDNSRGTLALDSPQVRVTRRVYRGGEGEYLINKQPCRLRDVKDLFAGTGLATQAYSVIEQGKVDGLLQSSPKDRRAIFEEAAGISRFKAKKLETERRLDRVRQNLLRLSDIVSEVESRLRSVRSQASKAQQYREWSDRLKELRTATAAADYARLTSEIARQGELLEQKKTDCDVARAQADDHDAKALDLEIDLAEGERRLRAVEARIAQIRERLAALETARSMSLTRDEEYAESEKRELAAAASVGQRTDAFALEVARADSARKGALSALEQSKQALGALQEKLRAAEIEQRKAKEVFEEQEGHLSLAKERAHQALAQLRAHDATEAGHKRQLEQLAARRSALQNEQSALQASVDAQASALSKLVAAQRRSESQWRAATAALRDVEAEHEQFRQQVEALLHERIALTERSQALLEWESHGQGGMAAAQAAIAHAAHHREQGIRLLGLLANQVQVETKYVPAMEALLADHADGIVLSIEDGAKLVAWLEQLPAEARTHFLLPFEGPLSPAEDFSTLPGVLADCRNLVRCDDGLRPLIDRILRGAWLVENLEVAVHLGERYAGKGRWVTPEGDLITQEGLLCLGKSEKGHGTLALQAERVTLSNRIATCERRLTEAQDEERKCSLRLAERRTDAERARQSVQNEQQNLAVGEAARAGFANSLAQLRQAKEQTEAEMEQTQAELAKLANERTSRLQESDLLAKQVQECTALLAAAQEQMLQSQAQVDALREQIMQAQIEAARSQQLWENASASFAAAEARLREHGENSGQHEQTMRALSAQRQACQLSALRGGQDHAENVLLKEKLLDEAAICLRHREQVRQARQQELEATKSLQARAAKLEQEKHQAELRIAECTQNRIVLVERMQEDYELDLPAYAGEVHPSVKERRDEVDAEIQRLRRRLNSLGGVNLEALGELEVLESRFETLHGQFQDLNEAKESLERIIHKINAESRKLFAATLNEVAENFRTLFRKLFGGGSAEIVVEEGEDLLEAGIEIVARPPGKELRSISLLSGGEKTLTCVALLLAVFKTRPSPFCVLDEVDAALDESNIQRFVEVLRDFLESTQFIVVTHSKRTMAAADTLYGVTMQESGVSKLVGVRFEDATVKAEENAA